MEPKTVILNFSHIYEQEDFYRDSRFSWVDCTDLTGTNCYCSPQAAAEILRRINPYPAGAVHFLDSGNYHYATVFWMRKLKQPFQLLLLDHHCDLQQPVFSGVLSCGGWVRYAIKHNPFLRKVCIVGPDASAFLRIAPSLRRRLRCISLQALRTQETWRALRRGKEQFPLYISIDKDVLHTDFARTNWSQGALSLSLLKKLLSLFFSKSRILGVDVCGESQAGAPFLPHNPDIAINNATNLELLRFFRKQNTP